MLREFIVLEVGCKATWCNMLQYKKKVSRVQIQVMW